jgi:hypothetical protein
MNKKIEDQYEIFGKCRRQRNEKTYLSDLNFVFFPKDEIYFYLS